MVIALVGHAELCRAEKAEGELMELHPRIGVIGVERGVGGEKKTDGCRRVACQKMLQV